MLRRFFFFFFTHNRALLLLEQRGRFFGVLSSLPDEPARSHKPLGFILLSLSADFN
jgi:hypothetical protein